MVLNLGWLFLSLVACGFGCLKSEPDVPLALFYASAGVALMGVRSRGLGLSLWVLAFGLMVVGQSHASSRPDMAWAPLQLGALLATYNLGSRAPFTPTVALSQALTIFAPVPRLVAYFGWEAPVCAVVGLLLAGFAAFATGLWDYANQERSSRLAD